MDIKHRNLFRITRFILLKLPVLLKFFAKFRSPQKRLLIIKIDAIGDYILFRNFIEIVKKSALFKDYQIDLAGNVLWQEIALKYDSDFISNSLFANPSHLYESPLQILKLALQLFKNNYHTVLQPTFARTFITDGLAAFTAAKYIIGFEGDTERINIKYKVKTDKFYTQRIQIPQHIVFEFEKSRFFFESVLKEELAIAGTSITTESGVKCGILIFPGSGVYKRNWEAEKFLALIMQIIKHSKHRVYLAGGAGELKACNYLTANLPSGSVDNLAGKTTLNQLIELIGNAVLVVSNESGAIHIAAAVKTKAVCILGGGHFGRFAPYPQKMENAPLCLYEKMDCYYCNWNCKYKTAESEPFPCISAIGFEKVWNAIQPYL